MQIRLIDYGGKAPQRAHANDAGADVFTRIDNEHKAIMILPGETKKVPLGIGVYLPNGFAGFVMPRSGLSSEGLTTEIVPIDSGYTGEIHAIVHNKSKEARQIPNNMKIAQLVIVPVVIANFTYEEADTRGDNGFGSTGI